MPIHTRVNRDAPIDGNTWGRKDGRWQIVVENVGSGSAEPTSPDFQYDGNDNLVRIDYAGTPYKIFTYSGTQLTQVDWYFPDDSIIERREFFYVGDQLDYITDSIVPIP